MQAPRPDDLVTRAAMVAAWPGFGRLPSGGSTELAADDGDEQAALISDASSAVERHCGRSFGRATYTEAVRGANRPRIWLARRPVIAITAVVVDGEALDNTSGTAWQFDRDTGEVLRGSWLGDPHFGPWFPRGFGNIAVTYEAGYALAAGQVDASPTHRVDLLPRDIVRATKLVVRHLAEAMDAIGPVKKKKLGEFEYELEDLEGLPATVFKLLAPYVEIAI